MFLDVVIILPHQLLIFKMIKNILIITSLFLSYNSFAQDDVGTARWASTPIVIDGNATEWKLPLRYYDSDTRLFFAFANDDKNLYLCFQSPDQVNQKRIMRAGMEIMLSCKGVRKVAVNFPLSQQGSGHAVENNDQAALSKQEKRTSFILQNATMEVKGFATREGLIPIDDSSGLHAAINWDDNDRLTYEIAIPLKEWFGSAYTPADIAKEISIEIEVKPLKLPSHAGVASGAGSGFSGGGGGRGGRQHTGGNHEKSTAVNTDDGTEMPGDNKMLLYQKSKLKEKFFLAKAAPNS